MISAPAHIARRTARIVPSCAALKAKICIIGHTPGIRVHNSGVPWDDPGGKRLRGWLEVDDTRSTTKTTSPSS